MLVLYQLLCMVCGREEPDVELQSLFNSQAHVIQEHKYCIINVRLFDLSCRMGIFLPRKMKVEPDLSLMRDELSVRYER